MLFDRHRRPLQNLRLSVTDRCNLRCTYCMPEPDYVWLPQPHLLTFEEMTRLVRVFTAAGVGKVRLTGGEPLLRRDLDVLVAQLASLPALRELAMTTNGVLLAERAAGLHRAGLQRVTISLDTLDRATFRLLAQRDDLDRVRAGIDAAAAAGFRELKLDTVVIAGVNDGELPGLIAFARERGAEVRFIEYMDVGGATRWRPDAVVSRAAMLAAIERRLGRAEPLPRDRAPAERFRLGDGTTFGIIASVTTPFCATCDRSRLTADGMWFRCLYAAAGTDLRGPLRAGDDDAALLTRIADDWRARQDRGAEDRARAPGEGRRPLASPDELRQLPHLEMHTRGG